MGRLVGATLWQPPLLPLGNTKGPNPRKEKTFRELGNNIGAGEGVAGGWVVCHLANPSFSSCANTEGDSKPGKKGFQKRWRQPRRGRRSGGWAGGLPFGKPLLLLRADVAGPETKPRENSVLPKPGRSAGGVGGCQPANLLPFSAGRIPETRRDSTGRGNGMPPSRNIDNSPAGEGAVDGAGGWLPLAASPLPPSPSCQTPKKNRRYDLWGKKKKESLQETSATPLVKPLVKEWWPGGWAGKSSSSSPAC